VRVRKASAGRIIRRRGLTFSARANETHTRSRCIYILCKCGPTAANGRSVGGAFTTSDFILLYSRGGGAVGTAGYILLCDRTIYIYIRTPPTMGNSYTLSRSYVCSVCVCIRFIGEDTDAYTHTHTRPEKKMKKIKKKKRPGIYIIICISIARLWQQRMAGSPVDDIRTRLYAYTIRTPLYIFYTHTHIYIMYICARGIIIFVIVVYDEQKGPGGVSVCVCVCVAIVFHYCYIGTRCICAHMIYIYI